MPKRIGSGLLEGDAGIQMFKAAMSYQNALPGKNSFCYFRKGRKHGTLKKNCIKIKVRMNAEFCSDFLSFVPKLRCSLEKQKKNLLESPLIYQFPPQMSFCNLAELFFVTFIIARKLEIVAGSHQNLK